MRTLLALLLAFSLGFSLEAFVIEKEITSKGMVSQKSEVKEYITDGYVKQVLISSIEGGFFIPGMQTKPVQKEKTEKITVFKDGKVITYDINHGRKMYTKMEMPASTMAYMILSAFYECDQQGNCRPNRDLKVTDEYKQVGKWKARKIVTKMKTMFGETDTVIWAAKDKTLYQAEMQRIENFFREAEKDPRVKSNPKYKKLLRDAKRELKEFMDKYGVAVMMETSMKGMGNMTTVEVVKSVKKENVPKDAFSIPKGYKPFTPPTIKPMYQPKGGYK